MTPFPVGLGMSSQPTQLKEFSKQSEPRNPEETKPLRWATPEEISQQPKRSLEEANRQYHFLRENSSRGRLQTPQI